MGLLPACFPGKHRSELKSTMSSSPKGISRQPSGQRNGRRGNGIRGQWRGLSDAGTARPGPKPVKQAGSSRNKEKCFPRPALELSLGKIGDNEGVTFPGTMGSVLSIIGSWSKTLTWRETGASWVGGSESSGSAGPRPAWWTREGGYLGS